MAPRLQFSVVAGGDEGRRSNAIPHGKRKGNAHEAEAALAWDHRIGSIGGAGGRGQGRRPVVATTREVPGAHGGVGRGLHGHVRGEPVAGAIGFACVR